MLMAFLMIKYEFGYLMSLSTAIVCPASDISHLTRFLSSRLTDTHHLGMLLEFGRLSMLLWASLLLLALASGQEVTLSLIHQPSFKQSFRSL